MPFERENDRFAFLSPPHLGDLGATYDNHLRLIGKHARDFLLVLIELFSLGRTAEELQAIIGSKSAISKYLSCYTDHGQDCRDNGQFFCSTEIHICLHAIRTFSR